MFSRFFIFFAGYFFSRLYIKICMVVGRSVVVYKTLLSNNRPNNNQQKEEGKETRFNFQQKKIAGQSFLND